MRTRQLLLLLSAGIAAVNGAKPNFIFIITDDQDMHLNSLEYQPSVQKHFAQEGTWFKKHFCTVSLCCPSRVSLLTGKAAHNTNVTDVSAPYGKSDLSMMILAWMLNMLRRISQVHRRRFQ
jgi:N-acetylglucosamine-6-sulfatase